MKLLKPLIVIALLFISLLFTSPLQAGDRRFTYVYETTTTEKGQLEVENWVTWKTGVEEGMRNHGFDFRHELEYGITDKLQIGVYVADWNVVSTPTGGNIATYNDSAIEIIQNLTSPETDFIGSALYGEVRLGEQNFAMEGKLLLQKNFGPMVVAYNAVVESVWEGEHPGSYNQSTGTLEHSLGASYQLSPHFLLGGEFQQAVDITGWKTPGNGFVYVGPNASIRYGRYYLTTTAMIQATALTGEADFQLRMIFGFHF
jgi:hypothetical protein